MMGPLELLYYLGYRAKRSRDSRRVRALPEPVISIGNITTGGTGKTPAAIAVAREARRRGYAPCVLTRGYGGRLTGPCVVTEGMDARDVGDEPLLMALKLGGIPVVKCPDRFKGGMHAINVLSPAPDLFVLDDGFQHIRLRRDADVLLVNGLDPFGNGRLLPMGPLREPLVQVARADLLVITRGGGGGAGLGPRLRALNPGAPVFEAAHRPAGVTVVSSGEEMPPAWLGGKGVFAFCAIAGPEAFLGDIRALGAGLRGSLLFRDHHRFSGRDLGRIKALAGRSGAGWIMTTEKDIMRLRGLDLPDNLVALSIEFDVDRGFYESLFERIHQTEGNGWSGTSTSGARSATSS